LLYTVLVQSWSTDLYMGPSMPCIINQGIIHPVVNDLALTLT